MSRSNFVGGLWEDWASQMALLLKNLPTKSGDRRDAGSIPGLGRSPGGGCNNSFQYSCLENLMDREAWQATVQRVAKGWTWLRPLSKHTRMGKFARTRGFIHFTIFPTPGTLFLTFGKTSLHEHWRIKSRDENSLSSDEIYRRMTLVSGMSKFQMWHSQEALPSTEEKVL